MTTEIMITVASYLAIGVARALTGHRRVLNDYRFCDTDGEAGLLFVSVAVCWPLVLLIYDMPRAIIIIGRLLRG